MALLAPWAIGPLARAAAPSATRPPPATSGEAHTDAAASQAQVERWIRQLGDARYSVRERAQEALVGLGADAFDALSVAQNDSDVEVALRAKYLMRNIRIDWTGQDDPQEVRWILGSYRSAELNDRLEKVEQLGVWPTATEALCRIVRFDNSERVSKAAALQLMAGPPPDEAIAARVTKALGASGRPAALWLRQWIAQAKDPAAAARYWAEQTDQQRDRLQARSRETDRQLIGQMRRELVRRYQAAGEMGQADEQFARIVAESTSDATALIELIDYLAEQKQFGTLQALAEKHAKAIDESPFLGYALAGAWLAKGDQQLAQNTARKAFELPVDAFTGEKAIGPTFLGYWLHDRGYTEWAIREFEQIIAAGAAEGADENQLFRAKMANNILASMLHDQGRDEEAAKAMGTAVEAIERILKILDERRVLGPRTRADMTQEIAEYRGRQYYYQSRVRRAAGDRQGETQLLRKSMEASPDDPDTLIALYRLEDADEKLRKEVRATIERATIELRGQILDLLEEEPRAAYSKYNQFAWLVGNTFGDQALALEYSQKSLEISPNTAGYLDTLGRCYWSLGDVANALKYQRMAVKLDPHSGLVRGQLEYFERTAERMGRRK